jgi:sugar lactone lactonase YvrE
MKKTLLPFLVAIVSTCLPLTGAFAQNITTIAGSGIGDDSLATHAELVGPVGVTTDQAGNTYIVDAGSYKLRKVDAAGIITTIAGTGIEGYSGDGGPATAAKLGVLYGIALDKHGNIYVVDNVFNCIRKINTAGIISTIAGNGSSGFSGDGGPAISAVLNSPIDVVVDTSDNIFFTDWLNNRVRKIDATGMITTVVGDGVAGSTGNGGPATASELGRPFRVTLDRNGNMYVASVVFQCICKVDNTGTITVVGGTGAYSIGADGDGGPATAATMTSPCGLAVDTFGNIYFSDIGNDRIRKIDGTTGIISNYAANGVSGFSGDGGPAVSAQISTPEGLAINPAGNLLICDPDNNRIRQVNPAGTMSTFAGQSALFGENFNAIDAQLSGPANIATDAAGNIYIADANNNRIRKITASTGIITTVAGSGTAGTSDGYNGDNRTALSANIYAPTAVTVDAAGNIYIADNSNNRVRKVSTTGIITTVAGTGTAGYSGDASAAITAKLNGPSGVAVDAAGNVYIADQLNHRIRKVDLSGIINTVAGTGTGGYTGDGSSAISAQLNYPSDIALDTIGNLYVCDYSNSCIRKVDTSGIITTFAGTGTAGFSGDDGPASAARLSYPNGIKTDRYGDLIIADQYNNRVRIVYADGTITTIAGDGVAGFSGDGGPALAAKLYNAAGVAVNNAGDLFIADRGNNRIRKMQAVLATPQIAKNTSALSVYPNPAHNNITVQTANTTGISQAVLFDMAGREVMATVITGGKQAIDISSLASGTYMLQVTANSGTKKTVKITKD